jgi:hypothetical protein
MDSEKGWATERGKDSVMEMGREMDWAVEAEAGAVVRMNSADRIRCRH